MRLTESFWERAYAQSGFCWGLEHSQYAELIMTTVERHACVAELGCGYGRDLVYLARCFPEKRFAGIDISATALAMMAPYAQRSGQMPMNVQGIKWDVRSERPVPGEISERATCYLCHSLVHLLSEGERGEFFAGLDAAAKPGSQLLISAYSTCDTRFGHGCKVAEGTYRCSSQFPEAEVHFFEQDELRTELVAAGLQVTQIEEFEEVEHLGEERVTSLYLLAQAEVAKAS